jgi:transposase|nr:MAG TPA: Sigma-70, region 4 [Bacteriophage sp.]
MTTDEKRMLTSYRQQGLGYKKIAQLMGLSVNTVKTYCKRNALGGVVKNQSCSTEEACKCCGVPLIQTPGRKPRLFCSDACRTKWWNAHPELVKHRGDRQIICSHCGSVFSVNQHSTRKYCSHGCYIADRFHGGELQ